MNTSTASPFESAARSKKAAAIALYLIATFGDDAVRAAPTATERQWEAIAICAGQHSPGPETRAEVQRLLDEYERARAFEATKQAIGLGVS